MQSEPINIFSVDFVFFSVSSSLQWAQRPLSRWLWAAYVNLRPREVYEGVGAPRCRRHGDCNSISAVMEPIGATPPGSQPRPPATMSLPSDAAQASTMLFFLNEGRAGEAANSSLSFWYERSGGETLSAEPRAEGTACAEKDSRQLS